MSMDMQTLGALKAWIAKDNPDRSALERRPIRSLSRKEYLRWHWSDVSDLTDDARMVVKALERTPAEVLEAEKEWAAFERAWQESDDPR